MGAAYFLQFLDKYILGQAAIFGLRDALVCARRPRGMEYELNQPRT